MERQKPAYLNHLGNEGRKERADISAWVIREKQDIVKFLSDGVEPDIQHYDKFDTPEELKNFITGEREYDGLFVNQEDFNRFNRDYKGEIVMEHSDRKRSSHRLDADERVEETLRLYSEDNDDAWLEYTEVSHE